ncbi:hypothetical protein [Pandoravirus japonicus]|uniref:Uncharacterized protein n=1 Tax=Pandoravirus japonicus TaxID=2823154 RepID=A0A811BN89_9VIRU|nr:hypothetical protein [Pandoravirus japonicus]
MGRKKKETCRLVGHRGLVPASTDRQAVRALCMLTLFYHKVPPATLVHSFFFRRTRIARRDSALSFHFAEEKTKK